MYHVTVFYQFPALCSHEMFRFFGKGTTSICRVTGLVWVDAEVIRQGGGGGIFFINIGRFVIVRPITATGRGKKVLDCPEPARVNSCVLPQSSSMSSITLIQLITIISLKPLMGF